MECRIEEEDRVVHRLDLTISDKEIRGVYYNQKGERCRTCLRLCRLCEKHNILNDEDPELIAEAVSVFEARPSSRRINSDEETMERVNQMVDELKSYAGKIQELSTRSDRYESSYHKAYSDYVKTSDMLRVTLKMYSTKKLENAQLQHTIESINSENERLRAVVENETHVDLDLSNLNDAVDTLRKTVAKEIVGKSPMCFAKEEDVERIDVRTLESMIDVATDDHSMTDEQMLERLRSMAL